MQKNILVDYGLRRITFLIAREVSSLSSLFSKLPGQVFDIYSLGWGKKQLVSGEIFQDGSFWK